MAHQPFRFSYLTGFEHNTKMFSSARHWVSGFVSVPLCFLWVVDVTCIFCSFEVTTPLRFCPPLSPSKQNVPEGVLLHPGSSFSERVGRRLRGLAPPLDALEKGSTAVMGPPPISQSHWSWGFFQKRPFFSMLIFFSCSLFKGSFEFESAFLPANEGVIHSKCRYGITKAKEVRHWPNQRRGRTLKILF